MKYIFPLLLCFLACLSCGNSGSGVPFLQSYESKLWQEIVAKYDDRMTSEDKITWVLELYKMFNNRSSKDTFISYLNELSVKSDDPLFKNYIYFLLSDIYWKDTNMPLFAFYAGQIDDTANSLLYEDKEIGYITGLRVIKLDSYPLLKIKMYTMLLDKYRDQVDVPLLLYELSDLYKTQYQIEPAITAMKELLNVAATEKVSDDQIDLSDIREQVQFYYSKKDWIYKDLNQLIDKIKYAVSTNNSKLLYSFIPKTGFSIRFFNSNDDKWTVDELSIPRRWGRRIRFASRFEDISNENEVYLETQGWVLPLLDTWYFYFKKIDYPYDDEINGGWEWKGIFFGSWL